MLGMWREQYRADREQKRRIQAEQWEQEKRWREEDRAASLAARERDLVDLQEHREALTKATGVSYVSLVCHEDSWTFIARETFGIWRPWWVTSYTASWLMRNGTEPTPQEAYRFRVAPNLAPGRITKHEDGMQTVRLSGHNLVHILEALRAGGASEELPHAARCRTLYTKFHELIEMIDPAAASGKTTGVTLRIDDSVSGELPMHAEHSA